MNKNIQKLVNLVRWTVAHKFEALVLLSVSVIIALAIWQYTSNKNGSWSDHYYYVPPTSTAHLPREREPQRDSRGETETRQVLEHYFRRPFPKSRPDFMVNPVTGSQYNLELDCYNESLRLAVEYQGEQHYKFIPYFHKNREAFLNQKYRDELKRMRCKELGITLIEVPYTEKRRIREFLTEQLRARGFTATTVR